MVPRRKLEEEITVREQTIAELRSSLAQAETDAARYKIVWMILFRCPIIASSDHVGFCVPVVSNLLRYIDSF